MISSPTDRAPAIVDAAAIAAIHAVRVPASAPDTRTTYSPRHGLAAVYRRDGVALRGRDARARVRTVAVGDDRARMAVPVTALRSDGPRVTLERGPHLDEWWVNRVTGLEHGYTLHAPVGTGRPWVQIALSVDGLTPVVSDDRRSATFRDADGHPRLDYDSLTVFDATGRILPSRMRVDDGHLALEADTTGAVYPVTIDPIWSQQAYVKASNTDANDQFGSMVAIAGDTMVVGAPFEDAAAIGVNGDGSNNTAADAGAAYVFVRSGTTWSQQAYLKASNALADSQFGTAVAVHGDTIVVGAPLEDSFQRGVNAGAGLDGCAPDSGAAYVFVRSGTTWTEQAYLKASNTDDGDHFGSAVAVVNNTVAVGAPEEDSNRNGVETDNSVADAGAVYVFTRSGTTWSQERQVKVWVQTPAPGDRFGAAVALAGDSDWGERLIVGAPGDDTTAADSGAAYAYVRTTLTRGTVDAAADIAGSWAQQQQLKASNPGANDAFGWSVATAGAYVVVGAPTEDSNATTVGGNGADNSAADAGAAYVFSNRATVGTTEFTAPWTQEAYLKASNAEAGDRFGVSVAIGYPNIFVGAESEGSNATGVDGDTTNNTLTEAGAVYVFRNSSSTTWTHTAYIKASNSDNRDSFGRTVAASAGTLVVGAPGEDSSATGVTAGSGAANENASSAGAVYVLAAVPGAPTITSVTPGNQRLTVAFTAGFNDGAAISNYEYRAFSPLDADAAVVAAEVRAWTAVSPASTASPIVISGLTNGVQLLVQIRAINADGAGAVSTGVLATPSTTPGAPTITGITPGNGRLTVAFTAGSSGGLAITNYEYRAYLPLRADGAATAAAVSDWTAVSPASIASPIVITGLPNGVEVTVEIRAVNANGAGTASAGVAATPSTTPGAPTITGITPGNGRLTVAFTAGTNGGSALTNYEYSTNNGAAYTAVSPASTASPIVITGLANGTAYTIRIRAVNANGAGTESAPGTGTPSGGQTITFGPLSDRSLGAAPFVITATASSGLTVTFASTTPDVCTVSGATVTLQATGTCTIAADQAGNSSFAAAPQVLQSFTVNRPADPRMALDRPRANEVVYAGYPFLVGGWALDLGAASGNGVDVINVWAFPITPSGFGAGIFIGSANTGITRGDVGTAFGSQFTRAGWDFYGNALTAGRYRLVAYARSLVAGTFATEQGADITVETPTPRPAMALDTPRPLTTMGPAVRLTGWAIDAGSPVGIGVSSVQAWAYPVTPAGLGTPVFVGATTPGAVRADVGLVYGSRFSPSAFAIEASGLAPGNYRIVVYAYSTVAGSFNQERSVDVTVAGQATSEPWMEIEQPQSGLAVPRTFLLSGWAIDRGSPSGPGIDAIHVWATRLGDASASFVGAASYGAVRPDVGAFFGAPFTASGYSLSVSTLAPGTYDIVVYARSTVTGTFNQAKVVRLTIN